MFVTLAAALTVGPIPPDDFGIEAQEPSVAAAAPAVGITGPMKPLTVLMACQRVGSARMGEGIGVLFRETRLKVVDGFLRVRGTATSTGMVPRQALT